MTNTQLGILLATIWLAPHQPRLLGLLTGLIFIGSVVALEMGLL
jgi:hypothetical protein